jgi:hypothetical protein
MPGPSSRGKHRGRRRLWRRARRRDISRKWRGAGDPSWRVSGLSASSAGAAARCFTWNSPPPRTTPKERLRPKMYAKPRTSHVARRPCRHRGPAPGGRSALEPSFHVKRTPRKHRTSQFANAPSREHGAPEAKEHRETGNAGAPEAPERRSAGACGPYVRRRKRRSRRTRRAWRAWRAWRTWSFVAHARAPWKRTNHRHPGPEALPRAPTTPRKPSAAHGALYESRQPPSRGYLHTTPRAHHGWLSSRAAPPGAACRGALPCVGRHGSPPAPRPGRIAATPDGPSRQLDIVPRSRPVRPALVRASAAGTSPLSA